MIEKIRYYIAEDTVPFKNLAIEEYLLLNVQKNECILYLWQNENTVVIGRNQNAWKECKVSELEKDGGHLVRRLSGGGAVYHDSGNLNFTFLVSKDNYDINKQLDVILNAVRAFDLDAKKSGRNDITIDDRKFSGNAFYSTNGKNYHHGTILINVDTSMLSKYLNVSLAKLESKGVESVKQRVINLCDLNKFITIENMKEKLVDAFEKVYELKAEKIVEDELDEKAIQKASIKFASDDWRFKRDIAFNFALEKRFTWGDISLQISVEKGTIKDVLCWSDAMELDFINELSAKLEDITFSKSNIIDTIEKIKTSNEVESMMKKDIKNFVNASDI